MQSTGIMQSGPTRRRYSYRRSICVILGAVLTEGTRTSDASDVPPDVRRLRLWARLVLVPVGLIGAALSFASIYEAALPSYGPVLAAGFPFLVDFLIFGVSLQYIAGARVGRPRMGWRLTAHAGVAGTLLLNAMAAPDLAHLPWHVVAPAVWSVLVEMSAREVMGEYRATRRAPVDRIPARLWLTAPLESARTWLLMARTGRLSHAEARADVGVLAAAGEALRLALPGRRPRRVRKIIRRQLRAGSLPPSEVLASLGWTEASADLVSDPATVLRATLTGVLAPVREASWASNATAPPTRLAQLVSAAAPVEVPVESPSGTPIETRIDTAGETRVGTAEARSRVGGATPAAPPDAVVVDVAAAEPTVLRLEPALDAPRRPFNDPIFLAPLQAAEPVDDGFVSTGDRPSDAVALLRTDPRLDAAGLAERLRALGWVLDDRTARQVHAAARHYLRGPLTAVH
jgi:hypothetical protein